MAVGARSPFGEQLRRLREAVGLTQEELAERAGLSVQAVAALESGRRQRPYPHSVHALADALGLSGEERDEFLAVPRGRPGRTDASPPVSEPGRTYLPVPPTPLVGREREVGEVRGLLGGDVRLVTLTGPGGVGKTRLALEVASRAVEGFPDGAAFVPLAPVGDPALVVPTVARSLGITEVAGQPLQETLRSYLRDRRMLLVLDNFEQVINASPDVADLLSSCPHLRLLVTSRAPLRVRGEREYPVGPLGLPELSRIPVPEDAVLSDAVRLFVERASEVSPGFELTRANTAGVAAICRRLDGLPLAIELAAARIRSLSPTELLARLDQALPLLTGGARDLPERQRTMRAAIEWSYQLLEEPERRLLNRLSVFRGGWELDAAEAVGAGAVVLEEVVLDLLSSLVEQSLVLAEVSPVGSTRYRLLVPVREYAEERLVQSGEAEETRRRHADYFLAMAIAAELHLVAARQVEWLDRLEAEHENTRAALAWSIERDEADTALRLAASLWRFWSARGYLTEGRRWMTEALRLGASETPIDVTARALFGAGRLAYEQGNYAAARTLFVENLEVARQLGDRDYIGGALTQLAHIARLRGEYEIARELYGEGLAVRRELGNRRDIGISLHGMGGVALAQGDFVGARQLLRESLSVFDESGDVREVATALRSLGDVERLQGEHEAALELYAQGLRLFEQQGDRQAIALSLLGLGALAQAREDQSRAEEMYRRSLALFREVGATEGIATALEALGSVAAAQGGWKRSAHLLGAAKAVRERLGTSLPPAERVLHDRIVGAACSRIATAVVGAAWEEGRRMSLEVAVAYALEEVVDAEL